MTDSSLLDQIRQGDSSESATIDFGTAVADGRGIVTCLVLPAVQTRPQLFSTLLMWLLADLFQAAIEQTVRLIRSKDVGVFLGTA